MFASLVMATCGRPLQVWLGAAGAFVLHAVIATTVGVALFALLPHRALDGIAAAMFLFGAGYAWRDSAKDEAELPQHEASKPGVVVTAVIAEWPC
jgi:putative Ca2+/H+ antiporter (TMEM165/GDT1 family)